MNGYITYKAGSYVLIGVASLLLIAGLLTDRWYYTHYTLLMLGLTGMFGGAFLFTIGRDERVAAQHPDQLSPQRLSGQDDHGAAVYLPPDCAGGKVMQFIPADAACRSPAGETDESDYHSGRRGTLIVPQACAVLEDLKRENSLILPREYSLLMGAVREVCEDLLVIADRVDAKREGNVVALQLHNYRFFQNCASHHRKSPGSCILCPCTTCSLLACMVAEGLSSEVRLNRAALDDSDCSLHIELSCNPGLRTPA